MLESSSAAGPNGGPGGVVGFGTVTTTIESTVVESRVVVDEPTASPFVRRERGMERVKRWRLGGGG